MIWFAIFLGFFLAADMLTFMFYDRDAWGNDGCADDRKWR